MKGDEELAHTVTSKIQRRGRCSNKRDKRLNEALHHKKGERWSEVKKREVATYYTVLGDAKKVEKMAGITPGLISGWKKTDWWQDMIKEVRDAHNDEVDAKMTGILDVALNEIAVGLEEGDTKYDTKRGKFYNLPVSTKDKSVVMAIAYDKRALLRGDPTSRTETISTTKRLERLATQFEKFANAKEIEGEVIQEDADNND